MHEVWALLSISQHLDYNGRPTVMELIHVIVFPLATTYLVAS